MPQVAGLGGPLSSYSWGDLPDLCRTLVLFLETCWEETALRPGAQSWVSHVGA